MSLPRHLANADSVHFWTEAQRGRLMLQKCRACGCFQFPPRNICATCWADEPDWVESSGRGEVESYTTVHRAPSAAFRDSVPYVLVAVRLVEGCRMISTLTGEGAFKVAIGDPVEVSFPHAEDQLVLPCFRRV